MLNDFQERPYCQLQNASNLNRSFTLSIRLYINKQVHPQLRQTCQHPRIGDSWSKVNDRINHKVKKERRLKIKDLPILFI